MTLWFEITAHVPPPLVEGVADVMRQLAPGGVTIDEPVDLLGPELGFRVRAGEPVGVRIYLPGSELGAILTEQLRTAMDERYPGLELVAKPVYQEDWDVSWREFFGVVEPGGRLIIVPSWIEHEPAPGQLVIHLDPGQAFGTGHHETTRLCLLALERHLQPGDAVLDVGTGSGVLAIAAVLLGAARVVAIDIDPLAANVARENCERNGVLERVAVSAGTLEPGHEGRYGLVVANISTAANIALAPAFAAVTLPGGTLLLSGILARDAAEVVAALEAAHFIHAETREDGDWCQLTFRAPTV